MEPYLYLEHHHTSQFEIDELQCFSDSWCQKIIDLPRKKESLLARLLLDKLCKTLGYKSIKECGFKKNEKGKPYLANQPEVHLSITHSSGYVWVAVSSSPIGIDFEKVNIQNKNDLEIAFSKSDWKFVSNDVQKIYQYFSLKESYSKMTGTGFTMEPAKIDLKLLKKNSFSTLFEKNDIHFVFTAISLHLDPSKFLDLHLKSLHLK
jgi:phosphopantetheinyl transferase